MGALLAPGKRTVSACLRMTGRAETKNFSSYHQILNRARWNSRAMARRLLVMIVDRLVPDGPVIIGMDDTIEPVGTQDHRARHCQHALCRGVVSQDQPHLHRRHRRSPPRGEVSVNVPDPPNREQHKIPQTVSSGWPRPSASPHNVQSRAEEMKFSTRHRRIPFAHPSRPRTKPILVVALDTTIS